MSFNPGNIVWDAYDVATLDGQGWIVESATSGRQAIFQDLAPQNLSSSNILRFWVRPGTRTKCWVGSRRNNASYMASFDLASVSLLSKGSMVTGWDIRDDGGDGIMCEVRFVGTMDGLHDMACGALINSQEQTYAGTAGAQAIQIVKAQAIPGTTLTPYKASTDRLDVQDQTENNNDGALQSGAGTPNQEQGIDFAHWDGATDNPGHVTDFAYTPSAFTALALMRWDGDETDDKYVWGHWEEGSGQRSWLIQVSDDGHFEALLSSDGITIDKHYRYDTKLNAARDFLLSTSFDGATLRMYINDVLCLDSDITKVVDTAVAAVHDSTAALSFAGHGSVAGPFSKRFDGRLYFVQVEDAVMSLTEIGTLAAQWGVSGLPTTGGGQGPGNSAPAYAIGNPTTEAALITALQAKGVTTFRYCDNRAGQGGSDANAGTSAAPYLTIQKLVDELGPNEAGIIRGSQTVGERYYEQAWLGANFEGTDENNRVWLSGSPEAWPIIDASEAFNVTWASQGGGVWRAPYNQTRIFSPSASDNSGDHQSTWISHQIIHNDVQLERRQVTGVLPTLQQGECFFEDGTGSWATPQYVYVRLPGDADPNSEVMRIGSDKTYLLEYSPHTWEGFPGSANNANHKQGRSYVGLWGLHLRFGCAIRKRGMSTVRADGWHVEHCAYAETAACGISLIGDNHTLFNNHFTHNGQYGIREEFTNSLNFQRNYVTFNNCHRFPSAFAAGGTKISTAGRTTPNEYHEVYYADNQGVGQWFDIDNGRGAPIVPANHCHHNYYGRNERGGYFNERATKNTLHEDCVVWNNAANDNGAGGQYIGPGIRTQSADLNTHRRVVSVYNVGKGILYKPDTNKGRTNNDEFDHCAFIMNCRDPNIDQERCEFQGGDDTVFSVPWNTTQIRNLLVCNTRTGAWAGVSLFHRRTPTSATTDSVSTFEGWNNDALATVALSDPALVVTDYTDEFNCYKFLAPYSAWEPQNFIHPLNFDTYWTP